MAGRRNLFLKISRSVPELVLAPSPHLLEVSNKSLEHLRGWRDMEQEMSHYMAITVAVCSFFSTSGIKCRDNSRGLCLGSAQSSPCCLWASSRLLTAVTGCRSSAFLFACLQVTAIYFAKCCLLSEARLCIREISVCFDMHPSVAWFKKERFICQALKS